MLNVMKIEVDFERCLQVASEVAREAGAIIRTAMLKPKNIDNKSAHDLVTDTGKILTRQSRVSYQLFICTKFKKLRNTSLVFSIAFFLMNAQRSRKRELGVDSSQN
jgi:hypothetical protein